MFFKKSSPLATAALVPSTQGFDAQHERSVIAEMLLKRSAKL
eukprot:gene10614-biopygen9431